MAFRDLGNVPEFEFTPEIDRLEHFSSRSGIKTKDKDVVLEKSGTLRIVMEELTADNLALSLMGKVTTNTAGNKVIDIMSEDIIAAKVRFVGTNTVGRQATWDFERIEFAASAATNPISDEFMQFEVTGEVIAVNGKFGTVELQDPGSAGDTPPDPENYTIGKGIVSIEIIP